MAHDLDPPAQPRQSKQDIISRVEAYIFTHGDEDSLEQTTSHLIQNKDPQTVLRIIQEREGFWRSNPHVDADCLDALKTNLRRSST